MLINGFFFNFFFTLSNLRFFNKVQCITFVTPYTLKLTLVNAKNHKRSLPEMV